MSGADVVEGKLDLSGGDVTTLVATVKPLNTTNQMITWTSSNPEVATVLNGDVYAIGFEKLAEEDYPEFTASTGGYEYSSECKSWCYEGPVSLGDKVLYRAFDKAG